MALFPSSDLLCLSQELAGASQIVQDPLEQQQEPEQADDTPIQKPRKKRPKFTPQVLVDGMREVHTAFPKHIKFTGKGNEVRVRWLAGRSRCPWRLTGVGLLSQGRDLKRLMHMYMEWGFAMYPHLAFEDIVDRMTNMHGKSEVQEELLRLREATMRTNEVSA